MYGDQGQPGGYFFGQSQQYAPMASGIPFTPSTGFEGVPGMSNPLLAMALQPLLSNFMGRAGFAPMGLNDRNVQDTLQNQRLWRQQMELQRQMAEMDRENWVRSMRGVAHMTGTPWGAEQMRAARGVADAMVFASPVLQMIAPDLLDDMAGVRGSAPVMAGRMMNAGRYRIDPLTGRLGQDPSAVAAMSTRLYQDLFVDGGGAGMQGFGAGRVGQLYEQMHFRGMLDTGGVGAFNAEKVKGSLKNYLQAVSAVRDIFGDMGRPDAPMAELLNALEKLTNGSVGQLQPGKLNMMVRMTQQLANATGLGLDGAMVLQEHVSQRVAQLGLEPVFAVGATQGAMAFGGALRANGVAPAWGRMNVDQLTQLDAHLRANAAASQAANRAGLALRLGDQVGGFAAGSDQARYTDALRTAQETGVDYWVDSAGNQRPLSLGKNDFYGLFASGGTSRSSIDAMLNQTFANREYVQQYGVGDVVRRAQGTRDVRPWLGRQAQGFLTGELHGQGIAGDKARTAAAAASGEIVRRIMDMDQGEFADAGERNKAIGNIIRGELVGQGVQLTDRQARQTAESFYGYVSQVVRLSPDFGYLGNFQNMFMAFNAPAQRQAVRIQQDQALEARVRTAMAPLNRGGMVRRAMSYLQQLDESDPDKVAGLVSAALGGADVGQVRSSLMPAMAAVRAEQAALSKIQDALGNTTDPGERAKLMAQFNEKADSLRGAVGKVNEGLSRMNIDGDALDGSEIAKAQNWAARGARFKGEVDAAASETDPAKRKAKFDAFWATDSGRLYHESVRAEGRAAEDVAAKLLMSDGSVRRFGIDGIEQAAAIRDANQQLRELALGHTGGDVGRLVAGDLDPRLGKEERDRVILDAKQAVNNRTAALQHIHEMQQTAGRAWDVSATALALGVDRKHVELAVRMTDADVGVIRDLDEMEGRAKRATEGGGKATPELDARLAKARTAATESAKNLGTDLAGVRSAAGVFDKILSRAAKDRKQEMVGGRDLARQLLEAYGVSAGEDEAAQGQLKSLGDLLGSEHGRAFAHALIGGQKSLAAAGKQVGLKGDDMGVIDDMYKEFDRDRTAFESKYGKDAARAMELQRATGMIEFGADVGARGGVRVFDTAEKAVELLGRKMAGGQMAERSVKVDLTDIGIRGTLTIVGDQGQLDGKGDPGAPGRNHVSTGGDF